MIASTTERVPEHTPPDINQKIEEELKERLKFYIKHPEGINSRLTELDEEWDIERTLETNGSILLLLGLGLGATVNRRWFLLPAFVGAFCLQHALQGWCPPLLAFRSMGVRTAREIEMERTALKLLRGDFKNAAVSSKQPATQVKKILKAVDHNSRKDTHKNNEN